MRKFFLKHCRTGQPAKLAIMLAFMLGCLMPAMAQTLTVTGTVVSDIDDEPLIGAAVQVKGTNIGVSTNIDGEFTLPNVTEGSTITVSYVGYEPMEMKAAPKMTFRLKDNSNVLEEMVVVGYGVQKKKLVTGATAQIKGDDVAKMNTQSPLQAMQGQMPGVQITSTSGQPGESMKVNIRGLGTVGNSSPLYLIDGIGGDISTLNPADIESIDVLKDAASAAIYGAQAANGVVLITTKSGKEGKAKVSFDMYYGWQHAARKAKMLNAEQYMMIMDEQAINEGNSPYDWSSMASIHDANGNIYDTDWINSMFDDSATTQSYTLGVTGGNATSNYAMSLGYMNQGGIVGGPKVSNYSRYNFRINSEHKLFNGIITVGEQASFVYTKKTGIGVGNQYNNTLRSAFSISPITPIYDADGNFNATDNSDWYINEGNPYGGMMTKNNNKLKSGVFSANAYAQVEPIKNLKVRTVFGIVYSNSEYRSFTPLYHFSPYDYNDVQTKVSQNMSNGLTWTWTNTAQYDFSIKDHDFNVMIGMESSHYNGGYLGASQASLKEGFDTWSYAYISNGTASTSSDGLSASGYPYDETNTVSYFGRLGWNWKEKYMINFTMRADGSSRFAKGHRFGYFPSVSAGWNLTSEEFMEPVRNVMDFFKLRASWGRVGNQNIDSYQYVAPITSSNTHYFFGEYIGAGGSYNSFDTVLGNNWGAYPSRLANEDVTWETSEQTNVGFDARFLHSRLGVNFDFYIKKTKDWLVVAPILASVGAGAPYINGGDVTNKGVELNLSWNDHFGDFSYSVGVNGAYNHNKVGNIPNEDGIIHGLSNQLFDNSTEFYRAQNGHAIGYFWGLKSAGVFQNQQEIDDWIAAGNGTLQTNPQPGDAKFVDFNHDGVIDDNDKVDLGNGTPKFNFGFNVNLFWKNFDLSAVFTGATGFKIAQSYRNWTTKQANYTTAILNRWTGEGTSNFRPRVTEQNYNYTQFSDLFLQDGDYLRISNITLGYDFAKLINQKWCSQARIYFQVQNLYTFTKYDGMDPEIGYGTDSWVSGVDVGYYPRPRTIMFGVNLGF
ncbi:MAG: TonB-dependent receptor [Bacteroidales bacterium]|nr:TonB-dependent receptor [Bacteroidales bacterium]